MKEQRSNRREKSPFMIKTDLRDLGSSSSGKMSSQLFSNRTRNQTDKSLKFSQLSKPGTLVNNQLSSKFSQSDIRVVSRMGVKPRHSNQLGDTQEYGELIQQRIRKLEAGAARTPQYVYDIKEEYRNAFKQLVGQINNRFLAVDKSLFQVQEESAFANRLISNCNIAVQNLQKQIKGLSLAFQKQTDKNLKLFKQKANSQDQYDILQKQLFDIGNKVQTLTVSFQNSQRFKPIVQQKAQQNVVSLRGQAQILQTINGLQTNFGLVERKLAAGIQTVKKKIQILQVEQKKSYSELNGHTQNILLLKSLTNQLENHHIVANSSIKQIKMNFDQFSRKTKLEEHLTQQTRTKLQEVSLKIKSIGEGLQIVKLFQAQTLLLDQRGRLADLDGNYLTDCDNNIIQLNDQQKQALKQLGIVRCG